MKILIDHERGHDGGDWTFIDYDPEKNGLWLGVFHGPKNIRRERGDIIFGGTGSRIDLKRVV